MENTTFKRLLAADNPFGIKHILIPKIQRSYAQGRTDERTSKTRMRFLDSIYDKITASQPLTLDFVYGHVDENGRLIPLDGQQRLTTLWLLHWYASRKENIQADMLGRFSYDTRYSARDFMKRLVRYSPKGDKKPSKEIRNEGWFPLDWGADPTVSGMFVMLDAIDEKFCGIDGLWDKLDLINFYFLPLEELDLTDEVYIKMNSRGKPLTDFEHFKAELLKVLRNIPGGTEEEPGEEIAKRIGRKIDIDWTDMLWSYRGDDNLIDDEFLRYFRVVCHLLTYRDDRSFNEEIASLDDFQLIKEFFTGTDACHNVLYLESMLDCWVDINNKQAYDPDKFSCGIEAFFHEYLSREHEAGKSIPLGRDVDILATGLRSYPALRNPNALQWLTTLFAFITFIQHRDTVSDADFRRRLRIVINLQANSGNEVVDTPRGDAGNRMPAILRQVEEIVLKGIVEKNLTVNGKERPTFSVSQLTEEAAKLRFTAERPQDAEPLFALEDHELLRGRTAAVGYRNTHLYKKFADLFGNCSRDAIDCAMLAVADYSQRQKPQIIQLGSGDEDKPGRDAWFNLFHPSEKTGNVDETFRALRTLLEKIDEFTDEALHVYAAEYVKDCMDSRRFDWRYYYLRYEIFRAHRYGKYTMSAEFPYELVAIYAPKYESSNAYQCFLAALADNIPEKLDGIRWLPYKEGWLACRNDRFLYYAADRQTALGELTVPQQDGIDTVDRIEYFHANPI